MEISKAAKQNITPLGIYIGIAVAGCELDEIGIGPIFAIPKLLKQHRLTINDIDLYELNKAFTTQVLSCREKLGIENNILNVNGGTNSVGHPYRMIGSLVIIAHTLFEVI